MAKRLHEPCDPFSAKSGDKVKIYVWDDVEHMLGEARRDAEALLSNTEIWLGVSGIGAAISIVGALKVPAEVPALVFFVAMLALFWNAKAVRNHAKALRGGWDFVYDKYEPEDGQLYRDDEVVP